MWVMRSKPVRVLGENRPAELSASVSVQGCLVTLLLALLPGRFRRLDLTSASLSALALDASRRRTREKSACRYDWSWPDMSCCCCHCCCQGISREIQAFVHMGR